MDEPMIVVISLTMLVGSYLAGCVPLFFTLNEKRIRIASIFGAGLLVGTAFCIIIPEGVSTLIESSAIGHSNAPNEKLTVVRPENAGNNLPVENRLHQRNAKRAQSVESPLVDGEANDDAKGAKRRKRNVARRDDTSAARQEGTKNADLNAKQEKSHDHKASGRGAGGLEAKIGVPILIGFLFMHVIDQVSKMSHSRYRGVPTLGLVIHAFADGIAMGSASSSSDQIEMQILVFVAIMLHKAPTAFALVSILLAGGLDKGRVRRHLLIFSLAAPVGTIITYACLHTAQPNVTTMHSDDAELHSSQLTGLILLFSGGTFLYIATVHVLPELMEAKCGGMGLSASSSREMLLGGGEKSSSSFARFSLFELTLFCTSALIPAFISSLGHGAHGHK